MENSTTAIDRLIEKLETYVTTTLKLYKYEVVYKIADIFSTLAVKIVLSIVIVLFLILFNIGLSLWIGEILGKNYYGFFVVSVINLFLLFIFYYFRQKWFKIPVSNFLINEMIDESDNL